MCQHLDLILLAFFPNNSAAFCGFHSVPGRPSLLVPPPSVPVRSRTRRPNRPIADTAPSSQRVETPAGRHGDVARDPALPVLRALLGTRTLEASREFTTLTRAFFAACFCPCPAHVIAHRDVQPHDFSRCSRAEIGRLLPGRWCTATSTRPDEQDIVRYHAK